MTYEWFRTREAREERWMKLLEQRYPGTIILVGRSTAKQDAPADETFRYGIMLKDV